MHSLQALALMQENRIASVGSLLMRSQRSPSSTDCPGSNGTSKLCQRGGVLRLPRLILSLATAVTTPAPRPARQRAAARRPQAARVDGVPRPPVSADDVRVEARRGFQCAPAPIGPLRAPP